ncbi:MAG: metal ABC transporter permease [Anaerolineales bacterium]
MLQLILDPLQHAFMQRGLLAAALVGIVCALIGTYVVLRGMAFFGDALAHAILPGVAIGYLVNQGAQGAVLWWGMGTSILTALGIGALSKAARLKEDTAIGVIFAGMFALGIAIISSTGSYAVDLTHFLFGNVLSVTRQDLIITGILTGVVMITVVAFYKEFMVLAFDSILAVTLRLPNRLLEYVLLGLIAVTIVVALQTVGIALTVAMLVTPAATAYLITRRLHWMMITATIFSVASGIVGLYLSFYLSIASGAAIVLTSTAFFLLVWGMRALRRKWRPANPH